MSREFEVSSALDVSESVEIFGSFKGSRVEKKFVDYNAKGPVVGSIRQIGVLECFWWQVLLCANERVNTSTTYVLLMFRVNLKMIIKVL